MIYLGSEAGLARGDGGNVIVASAAQLPLSSAAGMGDWIHAAVRDGRESVALALI
jgi:hypothetical protein